MDKDDFQPFSYDPNILSDISSAASNLLSSYNFDDSKTVTDLPGSEFLDYLQSESSLNHVTQVEGVEEFIGNELHYLSAGSNESSITPYITGVAATPTNKSANFLNRQYPTINFLPDTTQIFSEKEIGRFFIPSKLGILSYASLDITPFIDTKRLVDNTLYIYPDPDIYGSGLGVSISGSPAPIDHTENITWVKSGIANDKARGLIIDSKDIPNFFGYSSKDSIYKEGVYGVSRYNDNFDFWAGSEKSDVWANPDLFPLETPNVFDIDDRQDSLLAGKCSIVYKWRTDIFGNEYVLLKEGTSITGKTFKALINGCLNGSDLGWGPTDPCAKDHEVDCTQGWCSCPVHFTEQECKDADCGQHKSKEDCEGAGCKWNEPKRGGGDPNGPCGAGEVRNPITGDCCKVTTNTICDDDDIGDGDFATFSCNYLFGGTSLLSGVDGYGDIDNSQITDTYGGTLTGIADGGFRALRTGYFSPSLTGIGGYDSNTHTIQDTRKINTTNHENWSHIQANWSLLSSGYIGGDFEDQSESQSLVLPNSACNGFVDDQAHWAGLARDPFSNVSPHWDPDDQGGDMGAALIAAGKVDEHTNIVDLQSRAAALKYSSFYYNEHIPDYRKWQIYGGQWNSDRKLLEYWSLSSWSDPGYSSTRDISGVADGGGNNSPISQISKDGFQMKCTNISPEDAAILFPEKYTTKIAVHGSIRSTLGGDVPWLIDNMKTVKQMYGTHLGLDVDTIIDDGIIFLPTSIAPGMDPQSSMASIASKYECLKIHGGPPNKVEQFTFWSDDVDRKKRDPNYFIDSEEYNQATINRLANPHPLVITKKYWGRPAYTLNVVPEKHGYTFTPYDIKTLAPMLISVPEYNVAYGDRDGTGRIVEYISNKTIVNLPLGANFPGSDDPTGSHDYNEWDSPHDPANFHFYIKKVGTTSRLDEWKLSDYPEHPMYEAVSNNHLAPYIDIPFKRVRGYMPPPIGWWRRNPIPLTSSADVPTSYASGIPPGTCLSEGGRVGMSIGANFLAPEGFLVHDMIDGGMIQVEVDCGKAKGAPGKGSGREDMGPPIDRGGPPRGGTDPESPISPPLSALPCTLRPAPSADCFTGSVSAANGLYTPSGDKFNDHCTYVHSISAEPWHIYWENRWILTDTQYTTGGEANWIADTEGDQPNRFAFNDYGGSDLFFGQDCTVSLISSDIPVDHGFYEYHDKYPPFTESPFASGSPYTLYGTPSSYRAIKEFECGGLQGGTLLPPIWRQKFQLRGIPYMRNAVGTKVTHLSSAFAPIFVKYSQSATLSGVINWDDVIDIDIINDVIIIQTSSSYIFERISYDYGTNSILTNDLPAVFLDRTDKDLDLRRGHDAPHRFIQHFYNEKENCIMAGRMTYTKIKNSDEKIYHPEVFKLDMNTFSLRRVYPSTNCEIEEFVLPPDLKPYNITYLDYPLLTFNEESDRYNLTYMGRLSSTAASDILCIFSSNYIERGDELKVINSSIYHPTNKNHTAYPSLTAESFDWILSEVNKVPEGKRKTTTTYLSTNNFRFNVTIEPRLSEQEHVVSRLIYDFGDGTPVEYVNRDIESVPQLLYNKSKQTCKDGDSGTKHAWMGNDPDRVKKFHAYKFNNTQVTTITATVSAVFANNFEVVEKHLIITSLPYNIDESMNNIHIVNTKLYNVKLNDNTYKEQLLVTFETDWPRYISYSLFDTQLMDGNNPILPPNVTPSATQTATPTQTPAITPTSTPSPTPTLSLSATPYPTTTPTNTPSQTPTNTPTQTSTQTPTPTQTPSHTPTPTETFPGCTPTPSITPSHTPSHTPTPSTTPNPPGNNATFVSMILGSGLTYAMNSLFTVDVTYNNSGGTTWWRTGNGEPNDYNLGSQNPQDNNTWGTGRVDEVINITPKSSHTFSISCQAPATPGTYAMQWKMVHENMEWFGDLTNSVDINII